MSLRTDDVFVIDFSQMEPCEKTTRRQLRREQHRLEVVQATGQGNVAHRARCVRRAKRKLRYLKAEARVERRIHSSSPRESKPRQSKTGRQRGKAHSSSDDPGGDEP